MPALIVQDLGGWDYSCTIVDDERAEQIKEVDPEDEGEGFARWTEHVQWLACDDPDVVCPDGAPDPKRGKVLQKYYCQRYVKEPAPGQTFDWILFLG